MVHGAPFCFISPCVQIDDEKVTEQVYLSEIRKLNIQVENMCTFLPQDRVQDFAKQNAQEILGSTQKSVCSPEHIEKFAELKRLRQMQLNGNKASQSDREKLEENKQRLAVLDLQVDNIRKKNKLVDEREVCVKKKHWMAYEDTFQKYSKVHGDLKLAKG